MNIKFQCRDPWLVTPRVRPPGRCFFRPSTAAAGSTRPLSRGLQAARLPQASALLTATSRLKKALLTPPPSSRTPPPARPREWDRPLRLQPLGARLGRGLKALRSPKDT